MRTRCGYTRFIMKRKTLWGMAITLFVIGGAGYAMRPVCTFIPDEDVKNLNVPIEQRSERDFYIKVFQQRDGHWYQCKTALSRFFFF